MWAEHLVVCCLVTEWVVVLLLFIVVKIHAETADKCLVNLKLNHIQSIWGAGQDSKCSAVSTLFPHHSIIIIKDILIIINIDFFPISYIFFVQNTCSETQYLRNFNAHTMFLV